MAFSKKRRSPLESLLTFVNSFELRSKKHPPAPAASPDKHALLHHSKHKDAEHKDNDHKDHHTGGVHNSDHDTDEDANDTTLCDDWLALPSRRRDDHLASPGSLQLDRLQWRAPRRMASLGLPGGLLGESNEHLPHTPIPTFVTGQELIPRISVDELHRILHGTYDSHFDEFTVVDCRFPYEYHGGHIANAVNVPLQLDLEQHFAQPPSPRHKRLLVFHCEYSQFRGPTLAAHLRNVDRLRNAHRYPALDFPDIVVLDGGYKSFFDKHPHLCVPQAYVEMNARAHKQACEADMHKVVLAAKLTRAKSFNHFLPHLLSRHSRLASLTALLTCLDPAKKAKIKKKDRARPLLSMSVLSLVEPRADGPVADLPLSLTFDDDFAPPTALFRSHRKSFLGLLHSVSSSQLLVYSEGYSPTFLSLDLLVESVSPFIDGDYFDLPRLASQLGYGSAAAADRPKRFEKPCRSDSQPKLHTPPSSQVHLLPGERHTPKLKLHLKLALPSFNLPLSFSPASQSEAIDVINESPVLFSTELYEVSEE